MYPMHNRMDYIILKYTPYYTLAVRSKIQISSKLIFQAVCVSPIALITGCVSSYVRERRKTKYNKRLKFPRVCSVGHSQTVPGVFSPGIPLQRPSVSSAGHSYPYPELLEVLYDIHT